MDSGASAAKSREREPLGGQGRVVEEAQGDPAGVEVGVDLGFGRLWPHGPIADFERQSRLVEIEQRARRSSCARSTNDRD